MISKEIIYEVIIQILKVTIGYLDKTNSGHMTYEPKHSRYVFCVISIVNCGAIVKNKVMEFSVAGGGT